jgi:hypothetical protein
LQWPQTIPRLQENGWSHADLVVDGREAQEVAEVREKRAREASGKSQRGA